MNRALTIQLIDREIVVLGRVRYDLTDSKFLFIETNDISQGLYRIPWTQVRFVHGEGSNDVISRGKG